MSSKSKAGGAVIIIGDLAIQDPKRYVMALRKVQGTRSLRLATLGSASLPKLLVLLTFGSRPSNMSLRLQNNNTEVRQKKELEQDFF
jgi:hypothetical protein